MAVTILLFQDRSLNRLITTIKSDISNQNIFYEDESTLEEIQEGKVTYAKLISTLFGNPDYDIQINNIIILKENYNYQEFDFLSIPEGEYTKSYQYDSSGNIVRVIYKS
ncbi:MAG: hypothetical protein WCD89_23410 [Anaerocolumna sp.]